MATRWLPQNAFVAGEWGPDVVGRSDVANYHQAAARVLNYIVRAQGGLLARLGTRFYNEVKDSTVAGRLLTFAFNVAQAYTIEAGNLYFRFYTEAGRLESPPLTPVEVVTPYLTADLFALHTTQSADVMYIAHLDYPPQELRRTSATTFTLNTYDFQNGPFQDFNTVTADTLDSTATTGVGVTIAAAGGHTPFTADHVGSIWAIGAQTGTPLFQGYVKMTAFGSSTSMTADVIKTLSTASPTATWAAPAWSDETGWPATVEFYDNRLTWMGWGNGVQKFATSLIQDFSNLATRVNNVIVDNASVQRELAAKQVNAIRGAAAGAALIMVTSGGWWRVDGNQESTITPTNVRTKKVESLGGSTVQPVISGQTVVYVHRGGKRVYSIEFNLDQDKELSNELTAFNQQITGTGVTQLAVEDGDIPLVWCQRADGKLASLTFDLSQNVAAWSQHDTDGLFESVATTPRASDEKDLTWVLVNRTIEGVTKRYVEAFDDVFEMDSGLRYVGVPVTTVSGLDHLEGKTVTVKVDGAQQPSKVVTAGAITGLVAGLGASSTIVVGLPFTPTIELLPPAFDTQGGGPIQPRVVQTAEVVLDVKDTYGVHINGTIAETRKTSDPMDAPPPLVTGLVRVSRDVKGTDVVTITQPLPFRSHIRAMYRYVEIEDD